MCSEPATQQCNYASLSDTCVTSDTCDTVTPMYIRHLRHRPTPKPYISRVSAVSDNPIEMCSSDTPMKSKRERGAYIYGKQRTYLTSDT